MAFTRTFTLLQHRRNLAIRSRGLCAACAAPTCMMGCQITSTSYRRIAAILLSLALPLACRCQTPCDADVPPCGPASTCVPDGGVSDLGYLCVCKPGFPGEASLDGKGCIRPAITADTSSGQPGLEVQVGAGADLYFVAGAPDQTSAVRTSMLSLDHGMRQLLGNDYTSRKELGSSGGIVEALATLAEDSKIERDNLKVEVKSVIENEACILAPPHPRSPLPRPHHSPPQPRPPSAVPVPRSFFP